MTTVSDIKDICADLQKNGVSDIVSVYKGWQSGGLYNLPIGGFGADSNIGGTGRLADLIKDSAKKGIDIYLYDDPLIINPGEQNASFNVMNKVNKRRYEYETYGTVYKTLLYLIPGRSGELLDSFVKSCSSKGISNIAVAGITNTLFTYTYNGDKHSRFEAAAAYKNAFDKAAEAEANLLLEQPAALYWNDAKAFLDMPLYTSSYILEDEEIPFLSIVFSGVMPVYAEYTNFEANKHEFFLKMVESGAYPSFYITKNDCSELIYTNSSDIYSSQYDSFREQIIEYNEKLSALHEKTGLSSIKSHELLGNGITRVIYENGVRVYVNYGSAPAEADGIAVEPMSYAVIA